MNKRTFVILMLVWLIYGIVLITLILKNCNHWLTFAIVGGLGAYAVTMTLDDGSGSDCDCIDNDIENTVTERKQ